MILVILGGSYHTVICLSAHFSNQLCFNQLFEVIKKRVKF